MIVFPHMLFIIVLEVFYGDEVILSYVFQLKSEIAKHLIWIVVWYPILFDALGQG